MNLLVAHVNVEANIKDQRHRETPIPNTRTRLLATTALATNYYFNGIFLISTYEKATLTSPGTMSLDQVREDISMTPLQRLELGFRISDFAVDLHPGRETSGAESPSIQWIELHKVTAHDDGHTRFAPYLVNTKSIIF